jgi:tetratricopeptide (TPR) repeat protein
LSLFPDLPEITESVSDPTADDYAVAARYALGRKQLPRAIEQVSGAIGLEPKNPAHRTLLADILAASRDPLQLLSLPEPGAFYGRAAARAWYLLKKGKVDEALALLADVVAFRPNLPFLGWLEEVGAGGIEQRVSPAGVGRVLSELMRGLEGQGILEGGRENVSHGLRLAAGVARRFPTNGPLLVARCQVLRALGSLDAALELARAHESWERWLVTSWVARDRGQFDDELAALDRALALRPHDADVLTDAGFCWIRKGDLSAAERMWARAVEHGGTVLSRAGLLYLRALSSEVDARKELEALPESQAQRVLVRDLEAWQSELPDPLDPTVRVIRDVLRSSAGPAEAVVRASVEVPGIVAPSAQQAFELGRRTRGSRIELDFRGDRAALVGPSGATSPEQRAVAESVLLSFMDVPFSWAKWLAMATLASPVTPEAIWSLLLEPPPSPLEADPVQWLVHLHAAGGFLLGVHGEAGALIDRLLEATHDWVCSAGLVALAVQAETGRQDWARASATFSRLVPPTGARLPVYARTLAVLGMRVPSSERETFRRLRAQAALHLVFE